MKVYFTLRNFSTSPCFHQAKEIRGVGKRKYNFTFYFLSYPFPTLHRFHLCDKNDMTAPYCTGGYRCEIVLVSTLRIHRQNKLKNHIKLSTEYYQPRGLLALPIYRKKTFIVLLCSSMGVPLQSCCAPASCKAIALKKKKKGF